MPSIIQLILRTAQLVFVVVLLGLTAELIHQKAPYSHLPALTGYTMFVAVFGALTFLIGYVAAFVSALDGIIMGVIDALAVLFYLAGGIAVAVSVKAHSCNPGNEGRYLSNRLFSVAMIADGWTSGDEWDSVNQKYSNFVSRCRISQAICAFEWFAFACFAASLVFDFLGGSGRSSSGGGSSFSFRRGNKSGGGASSSYV